MRGWASVGPAGGRGRGGALTAAEQGLVHEPDVGEALLTGLGYAHLVADEHVPTVLQHLGRGEGAEWARRVTGGPGGTPPAASQDADPLGLGGKTHASLSVRTHENMHTHSAFLLPLFLLSFALL